MTKVIRRIICAALLVSSPGGLLAQRSTGDSFTWQASMTSGTTLTIRNINGPVSVERASGNSAEVIAQKHYTRGDPARVVIEAIRHGSGNADATVCAMWNPDARCGESGQNTSTRSSDNQGNDVSVSFTVRLPAGVNARLHTINGNIEISGASAAVDVNTINGDIRISGGTTINASTVSGDVSATIPAGSGNDIHLKTVNGSVTAVAPAGLNAMLSASTVNGSIESDFPVTVQGRFGMRNVTATIGNGGRRLDLNTINGNVALKRS